MLESSAHLGDLAFQRFILDLETFEFSENVVLVAADRSGSFLNLRDMELEGLYLLRVSLMVRVASFQKHGTSNGMFVKLRHHFCAALSDRRIDGVLHAVCDDLEDRRHCGLHFSIELAGSQAPQVG